MKQLYQLSLLLLPLLCHADGWKQRASIKGKPRNAAVAFAIPANGKGYVGAGSDGFASLLRDFWEYDPAKNTWRVRAKFPGGQHTHGIGAAIGSKGYASIGLGVGSHANNFYEYNPQLDTWIAKSNDGASVMMSVSFAVCEEMYVITGFSGRGPDDQTWQYSPRSNTWTRKADFIGRSRTQATGFSLNGKCYIGTGGMGLDDWYEYTPETCKALGIDSAGGSLPFVCKPNPFRDRPDVSAGGPMLLSIYDVRGFEIFRLEFVGALSIDTRLLSNGIYCYRARTLSGFVTCGRLVKD